MNGLVAAISGALGALLGIFALKPSSAASRERWIRAGTLLELSPGVPVPRVLVVARQDGWYRERGRQTVFLVKDGARSVKVLSAACTHLGCQVRWEPSTKKFLCPCHGGVYGPDGRVLDGPPRRPLDTIEVRIDDRDDAVLVRV